MQEELLNLAERLDGASQVVLDLFPDLLESQPSPCLGAIAVLCCLFALGCVRVGHALGRRSVEPGADRGDYVSAARRRHNCRQGRRAENAAFLDPFAVGTFAGTGVGGELGVRESPDRLSARRPAVARSPTTWHLAGANDFRRFRPLPQPVVDRTASAAYFSRNSAGLDTD
jgi:hypothetical protein